MNPRSLIKKIIPANLFFKVAPYLHLVESILLQTAHGFPARDMKIIGVTGTDGKTSTSFLIHRMLHEAGFKTGLMTTVGYGVGDNIKPQVEHMTTVPVGQLLQRIKAMKSEGVEWLVLETTSHALAQYRTWGIPYSVAVMTNLSHEHLDYHKTFENYRAAKRRLFEQCNGNKKGLRIGIVNADDANAEAFTSAIKNPISYGVKSGNLRAKSIKLTTSGSRYVAAIGDEEYRIECHLPGSFNVFNSLATVGVGRAVGLTKQQIEKGVAALSGVEGRMTRIDEGQEFDVIIDYAHTPDSFKKILEEIKPVVKGRMIVVFGSAGRRDEAKRAVQGKIAGELADIVVATEEDDRDIDGIEILQQIASGAKEAGKTEGENLFLIHKREEAIETAFKMAKAGDMVVLLGKGHEKSILGNGPDAAKLRHLPQDDKDPRRVVERSYNEIEVARQLLRSL